MYIQNNLNQVIGQSILKRIQTDIFRNILNQKTIFFEENKKSIITTVLINDIELLDTFLMDLADNIFGNIILIFIILTISSILNIYMTILTVLMIVILIFILRYFKKLLRDNYTKIRNNIQNLNGYLNSVINGLPIIQIFNNQKVVYKKFRSIQKKFYKQYSKHNLYFCYYFSILDFFGNIYILLLIIFSVFFLTLLQVKNISELLIFIIYGPMIFRLIKIVMDQYVVLQMGYISLNNIYNFFIKTKIKKIIRSKIEKISGDIIFKNVSFSYKNDRGNNVLEDISFRIKKGEKVAIFGKTGNGKTTIIKLMSGIYQINKGTISIGSRNIKYIGEDQIRNTFAYIFQEVPIFTGTIYENIQLYNKDIKYSQIIEISKKIGLHEIVQRFKKGYHTNLGRNGLDISFGEKQLINFTRVFLRPFEILILDEAFSNIDSLTQKVIFRNLKDFLKEKIVIFISHNKRVFSYVKRILYLENGKIVKEKNKNTLY